MKKSFELMLTKEEDEEFRSFMNRTENCAGAVLHEVGSFAKRRKMWTKDKVRRFIVWFVLEGLQEGWLIDEMGG